MGANYSTGGHGGIADGSPLSMGDLQGYELYMIAESTGATKVIVINDPLATAGNGLPTNYTFNGTDSGVHTFTNGVTLKTRLFSDQDRISADLIKAIDATRDTLDPAL